MPSRSETGHAVNLANAQGLYEFCQGLGAAFKPAQARFKLPAFAQQLIESKDAIDRAEAAERDALAAVNARAEAFDGLGALVTRAMKSFRTCGASERAVADAEAVCRKMQGSRAAAAAAPTTEAAPAPARRSVSQRSFDMQAEHFSRLVGFLGAAPEYVPGEEDLTVDVLKARGAALERANRSVAAPEAALREALLRRDTLLYAEKTGLVDTALAIKEYVLSLDKRKHPGAAAVTGFRFRNYRRLLQKAGLA